MKMMAAIEADASASREWRLGEILWSAVRHGGLLDERDWQRWAVGVQHGVAICDSVLSVELSGSDCIPAGRWVADPLTAILITRWHRDGLTLSDGTEARGCLAAFMSTLGSGVDDFQATSRLAWQLRLPGLLLAYACGNVPAVSLARSTWERIVYGPTVPDEPVEQAEPAEMVEPRPDAVWWLKEELAALKAAEKQPLLTRGRKAARARKADAARSIEELAPVNGPVRSALREWTMHVLRHEASGRVSKGYAPRTARDYLRALGDVFQDYDDCPLTVEARSLEHHVLGAIANLRGRSQIDAVKAVQSFQRFANARREQPIELELSEFRQDPIVPADLVLPEAYELARMALAGAGESDLAAMLVLMFRSGLRLDEVVALRVGDVCTHGDRVELVVEANDERALKTKTSRRILPLDVLLDRAELDELLERVRSRKAMSVPDVEAWLFGPALAVSPPAARAVGRQLDDCLSVAVGSNRASHYHLRHSFASFLLATLLLPQDVDEPTIPARLSPVLSPARFRRVADRLLGDQRLGASSLHAVSQLLGHTGPGTTIRHYCHLLELSLALHCSRPSASMPIDRNWLMDVLGVGSEAYRKAGSRAASRVAGTGLLPTDQAVRPSASAMLAASPVLDCQLGEAQLISAGMKRLSRDLARSLTATMLEIEIPRRLDATKSVSRSRAIQTLQPRRAESYRVPWRRLVAQGDARLPAAPTEVEHARLVDEMSQLSRRPRRDERDALDRVVTRFQAGRSDIRLHRLRDAEAFVRLLTVMGFKADNLHLSLTSIRGRGISSSEVHRFLEDRSTMRALAGRAGWRGSLIIRAQPEWDVGPIIAAKLARFALTALHLDLTATNRQA
jgi:site-specific recombinase XerD